jgi:pimeloyl-ACP methyl ester carboxylesterase
MNKFTQRAAIASLVLAAGFMSFAASAQEITIKPDQLRLNAQLNIASNSINDGPLVLLVHGTLAHNGMEIIANLQSLLEDESLNSLAINLSLGMDNRHGTYDCAVPHQHRHQNAVAEIALWIEWLKEQGVDQVLLAGHSRGGSQVAAYNQNPDSTVIGQVLVAPATWNAQAMEASYYNRYQKRLADLIDLAKQQPEGGWMPQPTSFIYCRNAPKVKASSFLSYYNPPQTLNTPDLLVDGGLHTVILAGSEDDVVKDLPEQLENRELSNVEFILVDGADHYFRDLYSDDIVEAIVDSIDTLTETD